MAIRSRDTTDPGRRGAYTTSNCGREKDMMSGYPFSKGPGSTHLHHDVVKCLHEREERAQGDAEKHGRAPLTRARKVEEGDEEWEEERPEDGGHYQVNTFRS
jgi:hypothetical protein